MTAEDPFFDAVAWAADCGLCSRSDELEASFLALPFPTRESVAFLRRLDIDPGVPVPLRVLAVSEDDPAPGRFRFAEDGRPHIIAPVIARGEWIDLAAFGAKLDRPAMTLFGVAWALGADALTMLAQPEPVPVMRHPVEWLRARGAGACFVDWGAAQTNLAQFEHASIVVQDAAFKAELLRVLKPRPIRLPRITCAPQPRALSSSEAAE